MYFNIKKTPYVILPKQFLKDKNLSLKAKGLLAIMFSLPDDWDYSLKGLQTITNAGEKQLTNTIKELEKTNYITKYKSRKKNGQFEYSYYVWETPQKYD